MQKPGGRVYVRREENWHEDPGTNPGLVYSRQGDNMVGAELAEGKIRIRQRPRPRVAS